jgi:hypothetical protein
MYAQRKEREGTKGGKESYKGRQGKLKRQARKVAKTGLDRYNGRE